MVAHVFHQYHHFFARVSMVLWVLLILEFKMVPTSYWHHDSPVSCFCGSCSPQRLVHVLVEDHKTQENYMYKNQDNRKSHEKYQP